MRALVTNDDGIESAGLAVLVDVALAAGYEVVVAAPSTEYSGASASLFGVEEGGRLLVEARRPPGVEESVESWAVGASPALITFLAAHAAFGGKPDLVLSGVNRGVNTGHAVLHSGTVGAALSAMTHGIRAMAVSSGAAAPQHWETARTVAAHCLGWVVDSTPGEGVLNVNVPDLPASRLLGVREAPLARFGAVQATVERPQKGELQVTYEEIEATDATSDAGLLAAGWATVTLLQAPSAVPLHDFCEVRGALSPDIALPGHAPDH